MNLFLITVFLFVLAFLLHISWWHMARPKRQMPALFRLFSAFFAVAFAACHLFSWLGALTLADWLMVGFLYALIAMCYVVTFPAIEANSPTLSLMFALSKCDGKGVTHAEVDRFLKHFHFIRARITALVTDGFLAESGGRLMVTKRSSLLFRVILLYRKTILGIQNSGG